METPHLKGPYMRQSTQKVSPNLKEQGKISGPDENLKLWLGLTHSLTHSLLGSEQIWIRSGSKMIICGCIRSVSPTDQIR